MKIKNVDINVSIDFAIDNEIPMQHRQALILAIGRQVLYAANTCKEEGDECSIIVSKDGSVDLSTPNIFVHGHPPKNDEEKYTFHS